MRGVIVGVVVALLPLCGCGLVYQGTTQTVRVSTVPEGATVKVLDFSAASPATFTFSRRTRDETVYQVSKEGYRPTCRVINCSAPTWIKVLDNLPAGIPYLVDIVAGALGNCDDAAFELEALRPGDVPYGLPSNREILAYGENAAGVCQHAYLYDRAFAERAANILISSGSLQRPYRELGNVGWGKQGMDEISVSTLWAIRIHRSFAQATPDEINDLLRRRALRQFGDRVDAVINVNYQDNPRHDVFATGVAVHFTEANAPPAAASSRLGELEKLRKDGLIDQHEYEQKRAEILRGL